MVVTSRFNATDLSKLLKKPNACVFLRKCKRHLALTPKALNNINDSVFVHLNRLVRKFDPELDAVVLGSRNVSILTNLGTIMDDSPHVHIDIEAEFYLFKPEKDSVLTGVVNKKSRDFIGCLVHDIFNVSIPIEPDDGIDIDDINIGQTLTFCVVLVDFSHPIPFIKGKLIDSREQSPSKQASKGKKRKRSDQLESCKKIKSEVDSLFFAEDNVNNTFTPSIKFPTSILKKATAFGVESSPARRISFYGDIPQDPTEETNITEDKAKKKKKKKKERETSPVEESPPQQKKKKTVSAFGNELETEVAIQDSRQIDNDSSGKQKLKKKKSEQSVKDNDFASVTEQDLNILQNFKDLSKKKKSQAVLESNSSKLTEAKEISKELNDPLKTKKKKKKREEILEEVPGTYNTSNIHEKNKRQGSRGDNEPKITGEDFQDQEHESPSQKKLKKSKKTALNEQEKRSYTTGEREPSVEKAQGSPHKKKKIISEGEGEMEIKEINVAEIINKTVEDAMKIKKSKKKGTSEVDVQQHESSVSLQKKKRGKKDRLQTLTSLSELSASEEEYPQESILQAVQLTPVVKEKKSKKISQEHVEVSGSRVREYLEKKEKFAVNPITKSIKNCSTITSSNRLEENQRSGNADNSFESLSPIEKSDDASDDENSGFFTSTQMEGLKTKKAVSSAETFVNNLGEVVRRNSFSDSDSFDVEEFSLQVPQEKYQNVKQKKGSKDHPMSPISSRERNPQSSSDSIEVTNYSKAPTKPGKRADTDVNSDSVDIPSLSSFTSKKSISDVKTVQSKRQKSHTKSSGADSSSSDSEGHTHEQHNMLQESRIKSSEVFSPKSVVSKGVQTDEESDTVRDSELAAAKQKKIHSSDKRMKIQSSSLTSTKQNGNDSDSTDSDLPSFVQKPAKLPLEDAKSGNLSHEHPVQDSKVHKKGTRKPKTHDGESHNIAATVHLSPQKQNAKSPAKKNTFPNTHKSLGMDSNASHSDSPQSTRTKMNTQKQIHVSHKKLDLISSSLDSNLPLSKAGKPVTVKQLPVTHKKSDLGSSSSDSDLPPSKAGKPVTVKQLPVTHKKSDLGSSSSDSDLPPSKAIKSQKQVPISHKKHDSDSSNSDLAAHSSKNLPPTKAAKTKKQLPVSLTKSDSDSSGSDSDLPPSKAAKSTQKQVPVSHKKRDSDSSSDSAAPSSKNLPPTKAIKKEKQLPVSHKKRDSDSSSSDSDLPPSKVTKTTQKQVPVSIKKHDSDSSSSDSESPLSMDLPLSKAAKLTTQKHVPISHKKLDSDSSSSDSAVPSSKNLPPTKAVKKEKQLPVSHKKSDSDSSSDSDLPPSKAAKTVQKQVPVSHKKRDSDSSSSDPDLPLSMDLPLSKTAKLTAQKAFPDSLKKRGSDSSSSDSDLPLTKTTKTTPKQSLASNKKSNLQTGNAISDLSSRLKTKIPPVVKKEPLSPHKSSNSDGKNSSGSEMTSHGDSKISTPKKKDTNVSKRTKQQSKSNEKKQSGSETSSIVKGLLAKVKTEMFNPLELLSQELKSSKTGKTESKKTSKESDGANSLVQTNERKEKKKSNISNNVDSSKHRKKSDVNSRQKHKSKEKPTELTNLVDELLKKYCQGKK